MFEVSKENYTIPYIKGLLASGRTYNVGNIVKISTETISSTTYTVLTNNISSGDKILGVITGFCYEDESVIGQGNNSSLTVGSNNPTTTRYFAHIVPISKDVKVAAKLNAPAGTTSLSDQPFVYFNFADASTLSENSVNTSSGDFLSLGVVPNTNKLKVIGILTNTNF